MFLSFREKKKPESRNEEIERRREKRYRTIDTFRVEFRRPFQKKMKLGQGRNISLSGARFATPFYAKRGEKIDMVLSFNTKRYREKQKITLKAKLTNFGRPRGASRYRAGCRFLRVDRKSQKMLAKFITWVETHQTPALST